LQVFGDAHQPGLFAGLSIELIHAAVCLEEGFLHRVAGEVDILQIDAAQPQQVFLIGEHHMVEAFFPVRALDWSHPSYPLSPY